MKRLRDLEKVKADYLEYQWWDKTRVKDRGRNETWLGVARGIRIT